MFVEVFKHDSQRWGGSCLRFVLSAFNQMILNSETSLLSAITTVWMFVKDEYTGNSNVFLHTLLRVYIANQHASLNLQSGAMTMATTTELARSGTVMLRTVTWWAAPVWETGKESLNVNPVSVIFFTVVSKQLWIFNCSCKSISWLTSIVCCRWIHLLWWGEVVPGGQPVAEGVSRSHLHLYLPRGTTGNTRSYVLVSTLYMYIFPCLKPRCLSRAGAVRTVVVLELKLTRTLFSLQCALMLSTATERTPYAN